MNRIRLKANPESRVSIDLPLSKSIANRELILAAISQQLPDIDESWPDDVRALYHCLCSRDEQLNIGAAGTAMRFGTAYHATLGQQKTISGSARMHERPIAELVNALRTLGASIEYEAAQGFPPVRISASGPVGGQCSMPGSVSSQYVSALLLMAPKMDGGIELELNTPVLSRPYIELTLSVLNSWGISSQVHDNLISIPAQSTTVRALSGELDWSAAAFFYGLVAQAHPKQVLFRGLSLDSAQGDAALSHLFEPLGVQTSAHAEGVLISYTGQQQQDFEADLSQHPDLAQAIAYSCAALGVNCHLRGLESLRIKETDRIAALDTTISALGFRVSTGPDWIRFHGSQPAAIDPLSFSTQEDHRMAMGLSILAPALGELILDDAMVVTKSFPQYWDTLAAAGLMKMT